jgi:GABA(A) receptor-associated protein
MNDNNVRVVIDAVAPIKIDHKKYLVPKDETIGQFIYKLRKKIALKPEEALFMNVKSGLQEVAVSVSQLMSQVFQEFHNTDNEVHFVLRSEEVFGAYE